MNLQPYHFLSLISYNVKKLDLNGIQTSLVKIPIGTIIASGLLRHSSSKMLLKS